MPVDIKLPKKNIINNLQEDLLVAKQGNRLINNITFFGDSAIPEGDPIYNSVKDVATLLAKNNYTIVDGGGPGIMEAATKGAESVNGKTIAVYWEPKLASHFEGKNTANLTDESLSYSNYVIRTLGLIEKGDAFIVCKGGTGTISEFGMVWCLAKLYYGTNKPVILYGDFWDELILAFKKAMYIDEVELNVLSRAQTPTEVLNIVNSFEEMYQKLNLKSRDGDEVGFIINPKIKVTANTYNMVSASYFVAHIGSEVAQSQLNEFMNLVNSPAQVLDLGCGPGNDIKVLLKKYKVYGIEMSKKFADIASVQNPNAEIINADIVEFDLPKNIYKGVWSRDALHHIPEENLDIVFKRISDSLVQEGILYIIVREGKGEIIEKEKKNYSQLDRFYHLFSEEELTNRANDVGLKLIKINHIQKSHKWLSAIFKKI